MRHLEPLAEQCFESAPAAAEQSDSGLHRPHGQPELHGLFIEYLDTGRSSFLTFSSAFDRGIFIIGLGAQDVALRPVTYRNA